MSRAAAFCWVQMGRTRRSFCCVLPSCVCEGLVRGGRGWVQMEKTPRSFCCVLPS